MSAESEMKYPTIQAAGENETLSMLRGENSNMKKAEEEKLFNEMAIICQKGEKKRREVVQRRTRRRMDVLKS